MSEDFDWWEDLKANGKGPGAELARAAARSETHRFVIDRETVQAGKTFSRDAMNTVGQMMLAFVEARVMERWRTTSEPPTHLEVELRVVAS